MPDDLPAQDAQKLLGTIMHPWYMYERNAMRSRETRTLGSFLAAHGILDFIAHEKSRLQQGKETLGAQLSEGSTADD